MGQEFILGIVAGILIATLARLLWKPMPVKREPTNAGKMSIDIDCNADRAMVGLKVIEAKLENIKRLQRETGAPLATSRKQGANPIPQPQAERRGPDIRKRPKA